MSLKFSQNSQENTCAAVLFSISLSPQACNFIKKETLKRVFFCEFCEIFKNTYFVGHLIAKGYVWTTLTKDIKINKS